jgi:hypothetical protein
MLPGLRRASPLSFRSILLKTGAGVSDINAAFTQTRLKFHGGKRKQKE